MIRILDRYVAAQFLRIFMLFLFSAPMLFIVMDITDHLDDLLERGLSIQQVLLSYAYQFPLFMLYAFPLAALIATVFTVNGMARHSEVAAAKAGGVSFFRLYAALPVVGLVLALGALGVSEVVPIANRLRAEMLGERQRSRVSRNDFVYRAGDGRTYAIRRLDVQSGTIFGVTAEREPRDDAPGVHIVAQNALYEPGAGWRFENGFLRMVYGDSTGERSYRFTGLRPLEFTETPEELLAEPKEPEEMGYAEMGRFIETLQRSGGRPLKLMVERAQKISIPVATLIIVIFAAPLAITSHRGGAAYGVGISLAITLFYLMLFKVAAAAGAAGAVSPMFAAWAPNVIFLLAAIALTLRVRT